MKRPQRIRALFYVSAIIVIGLAALMVGVVEDVRIAATVGVCAALIFVCGWVDGYVSYFLSHSHEEPAPEPDDGADA